VHDNVHHFKPSPSAVRVVRARRVSTSCTAIPHSIIKYTEEDNCSRFEILSNISFFFLSQSIIIHLQDFILVENATRTSKAPRTRKRGREKFVRNTRNDPPVSFELISQLLRIWSNQNLKPAAISSSLRQSSVFRSRQRHAGYASLRLIKSCVLSLSVLVGRSRRALLPRTRSRIRAC